MGDNVCLLINTGAPAEFYEYSAKDFLVEFLSDKHVIGLPFFLRKPLARIIAEKRAKHYAKKTGDIAVLEEDGSRTPLLISNTDNLAKKVSEIMRGACRVVPAYLYGERNIAHAVAEARKAGAKNFFAIPLYPQNCWATTSSAAEKFLGLKRKGENFHFKSTYCTEPLYITALKNSLADLKTDSKREFDCVLVTFHGVPVSYLKKTNYAGECEKTFRALRESFSANHFARINSSKTMPFFMAWQSNMNFGSWTKPDTDDILKEITGRRLKRVAVISPGFASDCTETRVDLGVDLYKKFIEMGGESMEIAPCLNASEVHAQLMSKMLVDMMNEARWKAQV